MRHGSISRRQLSKIYPGTIYRASRTNKWAQELFKKYGKCQSCGRKVGLEIHHIIPCHSYDELFLDNDNGAVLCHDCHIYYHKNYFPINRETFIEFCNSKSKPPIKNKRKRRYKRKEYTPLREYSKIKINDFTKPKKEPKRKSKRKRKRKRRLKHLNPIYLVKNLGCDEWDYIDRISLEKEVLGDY